jgi:predicted lipoprotein with Yx(FWY)xxD motif
MRMKLLGMCMVGGLALASACSSGSNSAATTTTAAATSSSAAASGSTVSVEKASGGLKDHLVGPNGHTLYLFEKDTGTTSACTGACSATWPALTASSAPTGGTGVDATKLSTATGQVANQVVYNGHLLYYFGGDSAAGQANGKSIPNWYLVDANGNSIDNT